MPIGELGIFVFELKMFDGRSQNLDWRVRHLPGSVIIADLGTKALTVQHTRELKGFMMIVLQEGSEGKKREDDPKAIRKKREKQLSFPASMAVGSPDGHLVEG